MKWSVIFFLALLQVRGVMADGVKGYDREISDFHIAVAVKISEFKPEKGLAKGKIEQLFVHKAMQDAINPGFLLCDQNDPDDDSLGGVDVEDVTELLNSRCVKFGLMPERAKPVAGKWVLHETYKAPFHRAKRDEVVLLIGKSGFFWPIANTKENRNAIESVGKSLMLKP